MMEVFFGIAIAVFGLWFFSRKTKEEPETPWELHEGGITPMAQTVTLDSLYQKYGLRFGVQPSLLKALAIVESSENPNAKNPTDPSVGLMQILCVPDGKGGCKNKFNIIGWPPGKEADLYDPDYNLSLAAQIIRWNIDTYGFNRGIAVYNSWEARLSPEWGPFPNQSYVDKVLGHYFALTGEGGTAA